MNFIVQTGMPISEEQGYRLQQSLIWDEKINEREHSIVYSEIPIKLIDFIPVGTVEFVEQCLSLTYNINIRPRNVPEELFKFANREIFNGTEIDIKPGTFIKSNTKIKSGCNGFYDDVASSIIPDDYQISEEIEILSEYRCFVFRDTIVGLQRYLGDLFVFPDENAVKEMIKTFINPPPAYTLDVGITDDNKTVIIEIHDFFACGLYGFENPIYAFMLSQWFHWAIRNLQQIKN